MTPPGEPLKFGRGEAVRRQIEKLEKEFPHLEQALMAAISEEEPHSITLVWKKRAGSGRIIRGAKVTIEAKDIDGRTTIFEAMFVRGNDKRSVIGLTQGSFQEDDLARFCIAYGGVLEGKGGGL